jgi:hypothetical protein
MHDTSMWQLHCKKQLSCAISILTNARRHPKLPSCSWCCCYIGCCLPVDCFSELIFEAVQCDAQLIPPTPAQHKLEHACRTAKAGNT